MATMLQIHPALQLANAEQYTDVKVTYHSEQAPEQLRAASCLQPLQQHQSCRSALYARSAQALRLLLPVCHATVDLCLVKLSRFAVRLRDRLGITV